MDGELEDVEKVVLREGRVPVGKQDDTKVKFFYKVTRISDGALLDDNNPSGEPLELVFGKKFKLEVWEDCLKSMKIGEVAKFLVKKDLLACYPLVAKSLRDIAKGKDPKGCGHEEHENPSGHRCCGMQNLIEKGLGYPDLDAFMKEAEDLEFVFEVTEGHEPGSYEKDQWAMDNAEKLSSIPRLHEEGNHFYAKKKYVEAADRYSRALAALEDLQGKEQPETEDWFKFDGMMIPLLLNYVQCQLILGHYNEAIEHATSVINKAPKNVKAWYRRAKAHALAWNPKEAKDDFAMALSLDAGLKNAIEKDLRELQKTQAVRDAEDRDKMRHLFG